MQDNETRIALLERDMGSVSTLFDKLDRTIDSIEILTNNLSGVIQLHERRLIEAEKVGGELSQLLEDRRKETADQINMVHDRINSHIKENESQHRHFENELNNSINKLRECIAKQNTKFQTELREELKDINKVRNLVIGGSIVIYILATQIPVWYNIIANGGTP